MKFGVREICNVVFKAKAPMKIGKYTFQAGQPVLYLDTAKTSTIEGAATTVYAQGGRGNTRLLAWEGEKTLTFTVKDALLSPVSFAMLSGAGLLQGEPENVHVHMTTATIITDTSNIDLTNALAEDEKICGKAPIFVVKTESDGSVTGEVISELKADMGGKKLTGSGLPVGQSVLVDYYVEKPGAAVTELQIDAENFAGYFYVEANTLFRRKDTGVDMPAEITFPNVKIQSNFTFNMASTGDPSTFTFTMDAFPGHTYFNPNKEVLCAMQIIDSTVGGNDAVGSVFEHSGSETMFDTTDSVANL